MMHRKYAELHLSSQGVAYRNTMGSDQLQGFL